MATSSKLKTYTLQDIKDEMIGKKGTQARDIYEHELLMDLFGELIKKIRLERKLTQEQLGQLIGVQKAQISKLEHNATNVTMDTLLRVFSALNAKMIFRVELQD